MTMHTLYTANGNLIRRRTKDGVVPVIRICRDEYEVDQQELLVWALLNWRIVTFAQIGPLYTSFLYSDLQIHKTSRYTFDVSFVEKSNQNLIIP